LISGHFWNLMETLSMANGLRLNPFVLASAARLRGLNVRFAHVSLRRNRFAIFRAFLEPMSPQRFSAITRRLNPFDFMAFLEPEIDEYLLALEESQSL
jgi:hypothetical protein